jgi:hypothetical protein
MPAHAIILRVPYFFPFILTAWSICDRLLRLGNGGGRARGLKVWAAGIRNVRGAIHQLLSIIHKLRILDLKPVSNLPYVVKAKTYSLIGGISA